MLDQRMPQICGNNIDTSALSRAQVLIKMQTSADASWQTEYRAGCRSSGTTRTSAMASSPRRAILAPRNGGGRSRSRSRSRTRSPMTTLTTRYHRESITGHRDANVLRLSASMHRQAWFCHRTLRFLTYLMASLLRLEPRMDALQHLRVHDQLRNLPWTIVAGHHYNHNVHVNLAASNLAFLRYQEPYAQLLWLLDEGPPQCPAIRGRQKALFSLWCATISMHILNYIVRLRPRQVNRYQPLSDAADQHARLRDDPPSRDDQLLTQFLEYLMITGNAIHEDHENHIRLLSFMNFPGEQYTWYNSDVQRYRQMSTRYPPQA